MLHLSINATDPEDVATFLAKIMGGVDMPFPPFPDAGSLSPLKMTELPLKSIPQHMFLKLVLSNYPVKSKRPIPRHHSSMLRSVHNSNAAKSMRLPPQKSGHLASAIVVRLSASKSGLKTVF